MINKCKPIERDKNEEETDSGIVEDIVLLSSFCQLKWETRPPAVALIITNSRPARHHSFDRLRYSSRNRKSEI